MKYPVGVQDPAALAWMDQSAKEFNLTRFRPICGTDGASWAVATTADAATVETIGFHIAQPGARVTIEVWARPTSVVPSAGAWLLGYDALLDGESAANKNGARIGQQKVDEIYAPITHLRVVDLAPGPHSIVISARKTFMTSATMTYAYRIEAFYQTTNTPKV